MGALIMGFDLSNYETVDSRLHTFWGMYSDGRIETELLEASANRFIVIARIFKTEADLKACATGIAMETISDRGVNANFALPNAETSAIGRALANAGFSAKGKRPSREEMASVNAKSEVFSVENKLEDPVQWGETDWTTAVPEAPNPPPECGCAKGMALKKGLSTTTKKPYYGYVCLDNIKEHAIWAKQTATGAWYFPKDKE
jgi:hypothetical protein